MEYSSGQGSGDDLAPSGNPHVDPTRPLGIIQPTQPYTREEVWHRVLDPGIICLMPQHGTDVGQVSQRGAATLFQTLELALPNLHWLVAGDPEGTRMDLHHREMHAAFDHGFDINPSQVPTYPTHFPELAAHSRGMTSPGSESQPEPIRSWADPVPVSLDPSSSARLNVPASQHSSGSGSGSGSGGRRSGPGSHSSSHSSDGYQSGGPKDRVEKAVRHRRRNNDTRRAGQLAAALENTTKAAPRTTGSVEIAFNPLFSWYHSQVTCAKYLVSVKVDTKSVDPLPLLSRVTELIRTSAHVLNEQGSASLGFLSQSESSEVCDGLRGTFQIMQDLLVDDNPKTSEVVTNVVNDLSTTAGRLGPILAQKAGFENNLVDIVRTELHKNGYDTDYSGITVSRGAPVYSVHTTGWPNEESDQIFHFDLFGSVDRPDPEEIKVQLELYVASPSKTKLEKDLCQQVGLEYHASALPAGQDLQQSLDFIGFQALTIEPPSVP